MRSELKSGRPRGTGLISYLKGRKSLLAVGAVMLLGLLLLVAGGALSGEKSSELSGEERIEERLAELCSSVDGVGECRVMVSCQTVGKSYGSSGELRVESVVILCRGGANEKVKKELTELVVSLYGIGSNRVKVGVLGRK